jgi:hypothetical protein
MDVRRVIAALAIPCACILPAQAFAQQSRFVGPVEPRAQQAPPTEEPLHRQPVVRQEPAARSAMLESWQVAENAEFGIGRFRVMEIARPRTNLERERPVMDQPTRGIAGAGLRVRFRR